MKSPSEHICLHCGIRFRWEPLQNANGQVEPLEFCCRGCLGAYQLICAAGLDTFYQRSDRNLPTVDADVTSVYSDGDLAQYIVPEGDVCRLDILVSGITCPSCIWLLERMLARISGVIDVSISYAGGIASVRFDPQQTQPSHIFAAISRLGYVPRPYSPALSEVEARRERIDLLLRFGTSLFLTMQLMAYSYGLYAGYFQGIGAEIKSVLQYASLVVSTPVVFYSGWPFLAGAWKSVLSRRPGMDLLIGVGALTAWIYSTWALFNGQETYFESAAMIVTFVLLGRLLELSVRRTAQSGIQSLYAAVSLKATVIDDTGDREIPVDEVLPGQMLLVRQGESFPVDSLVLSDETEVDQALVTGESVPVLVGPGDEVRAGCVNVSSPVTVQALRPVGQSYLMRVAALVQMAQAGKPSLQGLADRVAGWFVPAVILLAVAVCIGHYFVTGQGIGQAVMVALAVVLIACPCAMGLAVPAAVLAACSRAASLGIILKGGDVIERLAQVQHGLFDKTGTVTLGQPQVVSFTIFGKVAEPDVLRYVATLENRAAHPLARSLVQFAADQGVLPCDCLDFTAFPGKGICGTAEDGKTVLCGSPLFLEERGILLDEAGCEPVDETAVMVAVENRLVARFILTDQIRTGSRATMKLLTSRGIIVCLVSGDAQPVVNRVGGLLGIKDVSGNLTPDQKLALVHSLQASGGKVLMTGDGINDAPALAAADVSCSLTGSSDIAMENADVIITGDDLSRLGTAHLIACRTMTVIKQNLAWAFVYNIIGIPLAVCGMLTPVYAAIAMTASSLLVSLNSLRLMRIRHNG